MSSLQKIGFEGHLDRDSDPTKVLPGNYTDALNIQFITGNTESTKTRTPMKGNVPAFSVGTTPAQNKIWRLYTSNTGATAQVGGLFMFDMNGNLLPTINGQIQPLYFTRNAQNITQQAASIQTKLETIFGVGNATATGTTTDSTVGAQVGYIDIGITIILGYDWGTKATTNTAAPIITDTSMDIEIYQEGFGLGLVGENHVIGSFDLLGDLYVWSTSRTTLPTVIAPTISNITINTFPNPDVYRVTTSSAHGLTSGDKIVIRQVVATSPGIVSPNGIWIISVINATTFDLKEYYNVTTGFVYSSGGIITIYTEGVGSIGVGQFDANTDAWTYTLIAHTKQWSFSTKKQIDTYCEQNSIKASIYWTDDYNVPRVIYYIKEYDDNGNLLPFVTDGIISTINPTGIYTYLTIELETRLQITSSGSILSFIQQIQSGGQVVSGNWRYAVEFLSASLTPTIPSELTNPVSVYVADANGDPSLIIGDSPSIITSKINQLEVTGIIPGLFKYIQLIGVNYVGDAVVGYIIKRELLSSTQTSITLNHTGTETGVQNYDLGLLNQQYADILTARNMDVIDKRMILSNITTSQNIDFTAWAASLTHAIGRMGLTAVRSATDGTIVLGEYQDPQNVYNYLGYMQNETYRFGVELKIRSGSWTRAYHVQDITINCDTAFPRRTSALTDFNLTDNTLGGADDILWTAFVSFTLGSAELDYIVDGKRLRDQVEAIRFVRAEVIPTVLACGIIIPSISGAAVDGTYNYIYDAGFFPYTYFGEFPFISGRASGVPPAGSNPRYDAAEFATAIDRTIACFYSPDVQFGHTSFSFLGGDVVKIHGNPSFTSFNSYSGSDYNPEYGQYSGRTNANLAHPPIDVAPTSSTYMTYGQDVFTFPSGKIYKKQAAFYNGALGGGNYSVHYLEQSLVFETAGSFDNPVAIIPSQIDRGFYYSQYIRALSDQYGDTNLTEYVSTGSLLEIDSNTGPSDVIVFGGDTFTQINFLRHRTFAQQGLQFTGLPAPITPSTQGFGGGVSFYCQNRINAQMKQKSVTQTGNLYPGISTASWLDSISNTDGNNGEAYQEGYTARNEVQSVVAFDPNVDNGSDMPARIIWSDIKAQNSPSDSYRNYLPINFHDLDQTFGAIVHHANINGELATWQQRAFMRQYFNTRGTLEVKGITEILIGDGSVMSRDGVTVSRLGCKHKGAIIKGKSPGGNDTVYWINTEIKKALRFGYDGTVSVADIKDMQSFFANNLTWVDGYDTPADGQGICGFWDDRYANVGWTMRARRYTPYTYSAAINYTTIGQLVFYQPSTYSTFEKTGELFLNKVNGNLANTPIAVYPIPNTILTTTGTSVLTITTASAHLLVDGDQVKMRFISGLSNDINNTFFTVTVTGASTFTVLAGTLVNYYVASSGSIIEINPKWWEPIKHTNTDYYNEYTILYNEFKNAFITEASFLPKIYLKWTDTFLSPRPISHEQQIYQHNKGDYLTWYLDDGVSQQAQGYIEGVVNVAPDEVKWTEAVGVNSIISPQRMEFVNVDQESFLTSSEFKARERNFYSPVKQDSTTNGVNDAGTSLLYGQWLKVKMFFAVGVYQALKDITVKFRVSPRLKSK